MSFWYMATPYTNYAGGHEAAFRDACVEVGRLINKGVVIFSPIVHSHPLVKFGGAENVDHATWMFMDEHFMRHARGLIVLKMPGWDTSKGVQMEIDFFLKQTSKPVIYMDEGELPFELMKVDMS